MIKNILVLFGILFFSIGHADDTDITNYHINNCELYRKRFINMTQWIPTQDDLLNSVRDQTCDNRWTKSWKPKYDKFLFSKEALLFEAADMFDAWFCVASLVVEQGKDPEAVRSAKLVLSGAISSKFHK